MFECFFCIQTSVLVRVYNQQFEGHPFLLWSLISSEYIGLYTGSLFGNFELPNISYYIQVEDFMKSNES